MHYTDGDEEELSLKEVVPLIDLEKLRRLRFEVKEEMGFDENELDNLDNISDDESADSKNSGQGLHTEKKMDKLQ